ncbi:putative peroxiredoxin YgaF [Rhodospirillaceae bacterium LM-1]|nr:putative peroxiredoxin YgaF [Rhodospirillaceae bacterium LM-1]
MAIETGLPAPDFLLPDDQGSMLSLQRFRGKPLVLYFYPKDDTPGCTKQACAFQDAMPEFAGMDAMVVGVSRDSADRHVKFKAKYGLAFPLIVDGEAKLCQAYEVWKEKILYGRSKMGIERSTFLIDAQGVVRRIWRKVKVEGHAQEVLAALAKL